MIPAKALHVIIEGTLRNAEVFAMGHWLDTSGFVMDDVAWDSVTGYIGGAIDNNLFATGILGFYAPSTVFNKARAYWYDGAQTAARADDIPVSSHAGTSPGKELPNQLAIVASFRTGLPGRSRRGRAYMPAPSVDGDTQGLVDATFAQNIANNWKSYLTALKTAPTYPLTPVVMSKTLSATFPVQTVQVDTRFDVQRGRADKEQGITTKYAQL